MKNLKIKLGLFSLLAVLAVSVFLTSCEQEQVTEIIENTSLNQQSQVSEITSGDLLLMPYGFNTLSKELQIEYIKGITDEGFDKLAENHRIGAYLRSIGQLENVTKLMSEDLLFTDVDLSQVLSAEEMNNSVNYKYDNIDSRGVCGWWSHQYTVNESPHGCIIGYPEYWCCTYNMFRRRCVGWGVYYEYKYVNNCS